MSNFADLDAAMTGAIFDQIGDDAVFTPAASGIAVTVRGMVDFATEELDGDIAAENRPVVGLPVSIGKVHRGDALAVNGRAYVIEQILGSDDQVIRCALRPNGAA